jgi:hypothetical protein
METIEQPTSKRLKPTMTTAAEEVRDDLSL